MILKREDILKIYNSGADAVVELVESLFVVIEKQTVIIEQQATRISELEARVQGLENQLKQNSRNSSKPPSSDGFKRPQPKSLRTPGAKKSGGQVGHPGTTLRMIDAPDQIVIHSIQVCTCGCSLTEMPVHRTEKRQVIDLPPIRTEVTEHQVEVKFCPVCGRSAKAEFPHDVTAPVQYGARMKGLGSYLNQYQLLPYKRISELMEHWFGHYPSEATILKANEQLYKQLETVEHEIVESIVQSAVAHFDETGLRVEGKLWWCHVASTEQYTHYTVHRKRGVDAMEDTDILPRFGGTAVHDSWNPYFQYGQCHHALCNAHLLRELTFVHEQEKQTWAKTMSDLLLEMHRYVKEQRTQDLTPELETILDFVARYDQILQQGFAEEARTQPSEPCAKKRGKTKQSKSKNLLDRMQERRLSVLGFLCDPDIPFDNNQAERDVRMVKVQQKISGTFRTEDGANNFCRIRSYISTAKKNAYSVVEAVYSALQGRPYRFAK